MEQDLIEWLSDGKINNQNNKPEMEGLLLVPVNQSEILEQQNTLENINHESESSVENITENQENSETQNTSENIIYESENLENINTQESNTPDLIDIEIPQDPPQELWTKINGENNENNFDIEGFNLENLENLENLKEYIAKLKKQENLQFQSEADSESEYNENYYGEVADIKEQIETSQFKRGSNFTQRLKHVLKKRQNNAEKLKIQSLARKKSTRKKIIVIFLISVLVIEIIAAVIALYILQNQTPDYILNKASGLFESQNYDEAFKTYELGFKLYPDITEFSDGLKQSALKAGNFASQDEIISQDSNQEIQIDNENENENSSDDITEKIPEKNLSFEELLSNATDSLNKKSYENAILTFFKASELNSSDIRPWLGLASAYKGKRQFFDSWRILVMARKIFGNLPTIETAIKFLKY